MPRRSVESAVAAYEEHGVRALEQIVERGAPSDAWIDALLAALARPRPSVPASWLIRAYLMHGYELDRARTATLLRTLSGISADDARLHLCQSVVHLDVPTRNANQLARFLREGVRGSHAFTRAWATDAFHRLSLQHRRFRSEASACLERAGRDRAASVRARARRIAAERG